MTWPRIITALLFVSQLVFAKSSTPSVDWNGYGQFRAYQNSDAFGFRVRRAKLWVTGHTRQRNIRYKVMGLFGYNRFGDFGLLDAYADYVFQNGAIRFGQQIPEFSLQREQPDWQIPLVERAAVIDRMIPSAQSRARDIGVQMVWQPAGHFWHVAAGLFNGNGANLKSHNATDFLATLRTTVTLRFAQHYSWHIGGSMMVRRVDAADFSLIFGDNQPFTGTDFRYGLETLLVLNKLELQGEYLHADFDGREASGYYLYANFNLSSQDQLVLSTEQVSDLNPKTDDDAWLIAGYNHLFDGHNLKLMLSGGTQFNDNYSITTQLQLFFN